MVAKNKKFTAKEEMEIMFFSKGPLSFEEVHLQKKYSYSRKRHFLVYNVDDKDTRENIVLIQDFKIPLFSNSSGQITYAQTNVIEQLHNEKQIWMYVYTERPVNSYVVSQAIAIMNNLDENNFFTDVALSQNEKRNIKRYDYIKIKSFQMCIEMMKKEKKKKQI